MAVFQNPERVIERVLGNTEPLSAQILDLQGEPIDLTGRSIICRMVRMPAGKAVIDDQEALVEDGELGLVSYTPQPDEVATAGRHAVYWLDVTEEPHRRWPYDGAKYILNIKRETQQ